jgi:hypothetical protein
MNTSFYGVFAALLTPGDAKGSVLGSGPREYPRFDLKERKDLIARTVREGKRKLEILASRRQRKVSLLVVAAQLDIDVVRWDFRTV